MEQLSRSRILVHADQIGVLWQQTRDPLIVPLLRLSVFLCLVMSMMLFVDRLCMGVVITYVKLFGKKPEARYIIKYYSAHLEKTAMATCKDAAADDDDVELGACKTSASSHPMVLVQIPMHNEKEVYQLSIASACGLRWPSDRIVIQVLDDSTVPFIKELIQAECQRWASKGVNIRYETRGDRVGFKAGSLREGMKKSYVKQCDFVAIFDADFQPESDYLVRTMPFLVHNPEIGLVQARWTFVNSEECMLTRMQQMTLDYHFTVEQEVGSATCAFFGFNGTAGVWRISALNEAGGWMDRTTVEDMDLAVRASLHGWKFVYLSDVKVKNELPSTFKAYRHQQDRWSSGPANLFRKTALELARNTKVSVWKKIYVIYSFFFVRKIVAHVVTFTFYCLLLPTTVLFPEVRVPMWAAVYIPSIVTLLNAVGTPRSFHLLVFWVLFENVMSMHRTMATIAGLLNAGEVNTWVVTQKLGDAINRKLDSKPLKRPLIKITERIHPMELVMGSYLLFCGYCDFAYGRKDYFMFILPQSVAFFIVAFGYVGTNHYS